MHSYVFTNVRFAEKDLKSLKIKKPINILSPSPKNSGIFKSTLNRTFYFYF